MQPLQDPLSVPRRALDVEDYIDIVRRHRAWIIGPVFASLVLGVVIAFLWPNTYISEAVIRVVPAQVPERYVPTNVSSVISQRINSMYQTVTSRGNLQSIIQTYGLYPRDRRRLPMEDIVENMRDDIEIRGSQTLDQQGNRQPTTAFMIRFAYSDRLTAQKVTAELVSRFIDENARERGNQSVMTTEFLNMQLENAKKDLTDIENRLTAFRLRHAGRLPDQLQTNLQQLRTLESQYSSASAAINRATQDKLQLEANLGILRDQLKAVSSAGGGLEMVARNERVVELERQITNLELNLSASRQHYRDTHPDVKRLQAQIAVLKTTRDALLKQDDQKKAEQPAQPKPVNPLQARQVLDLEAAIAKVQTAIQAIDLQVEQYVKEQARLDKGIKAYQQRIESSPLSEREYADLMREASLAKQKYEELTVKKSASSIATDLENRKQGETLELLDPASLPQTPAKPNRWLIVGVSFGVGCVMGLFLAGAREVKDTSLKNLKDVRAYTSLTILGSVPLLESDLVVRRRRRLTWLAWSTACIVGVLMMAGSVYYYLTTST